MPSMINFRGRPRWRARVTVWGVTKSKMFPDASKQAERDAATWESETKALLKKQLTTRTTSVSVKQWAVAYLKEIEMYVAKGARAAKTLDEKQRAFKRLAAYMTSLELPGLSPIETLDRNFCRKFLKHVFKERSGSQAIRTRKNLGHAWDWGADEWEHAWPAFRNPLKAVHSKEFPQKVNPRYVPPLTDFWKVFHTADDLQDRTMLLTYFTTAARKKEVFNLKLSDLDFDRRRIRLFTRKREGGVLEYDWLPMKKELQQALVVWLKQRAAIAGIDPEHVFVCLSELPCTDAYYGKPYQNRRHHMGTLCKRAEVKPFGYHSIRHLVASELHRKGYDVGYIQELLRHKSPLTTTKYLQSLGLERIRKAVDEGIVVPQNVKRLSIKQVRKTIEEGIEVKADLISLDAYRKQKRSQAG